MAMRKDIRDFQGPELDVLLLSWQALFQEDPGGAGSWFQMAGIHGMPYAPYNAFKWKLPDSDKGDVTGEFYGGYCFHNSQIFGTWHRPYLLLVEQVRPSLATDTGLSFFGLCVGGKSPDPVWCGG
jgi:tyrosinase